MVNFEPGESMRKVFLQSVTQRGCSAEKIRTLPKRSQTYDLLATGAHNRKRNFHALVSRRFHGPVYYWNGFGANFEYLLNSTNQAAKQQNNKTDLKMIFFLPFNNI